MRTIPSHPIAAMSTLLIIIVISLQTNPVTAIPRQQTNSGGTRILVDASDSATLRALGQHDATMLVSYGPFSLWRTNSTSLAQLRQGSVASSSELDRLYLRDSTIDTTAPVPAVAPTLQQQMTAGPQLWLVQFIGPIQDQWLADLQSDGLTPVVYMPNNAYVVWGQEAALQRTTARIGQGGPVNWTGLYHPAYRLAPALKDVGRAQADSTTDVTVQLYTTPQTAQSLARLRALGGQVYREPDQVVDFTNISLAVPTTLVASIATWTDVFNVEPWQTVAKMDEAQGQIIAGNLAGGGPSGPGYLSWLQSKGFPATPTSYPIVDIVDDGVDQGDAANPLHPDFRVLGTGVSRISSMDNCTSSPKGNGIDGHGNLNAGIVGGYNDRSGAAYEDAQGYNYGLGISPYGRIASTKIFDDFSNSDLSQCGGNDGGVVLSSIQKGATITSNSWGCDRNVDPSCAGAPYNASAQAYDALTRDASATVVGNQQMLHVFSAGNAGSQTRTVSMPGTAKNVITVGASENVRDNGTFDRCGEANADNSNDIATFSARGPTSDGRAKPDLVAPGTHIEGPASQDPGFTGKYVCGTWNNRYYPANQTLYTWSTGTSHSAPAVSGAASLITEYYGRVLKPNQTPSPAMVKALMLNSARYLTGTSANDTLPGVAQGWGGLNLGPLFDATTSRILVDQTTLFSATGNTYQTVVTPGSAAKPLAVTLAWTDAPGSTTGNAYVNNLDLEVTVGGTIYRGNIFAGRASTSGGSFDVRNNVEQVLLPAGTSGPISVRVIAANIAGDGVPGNGDLTDQDFALVISNASSTAPATPVLAVGTLTINDSAGNHNGVADPGETIAVSVPLINVGNGAATGVSGRLSAGNGGMVISSTLTYPDIPANATASQIFQVVINNQPCGTALALQVTVGATNQPASASASASFDIGVAPAGSTFSYAFIGTSTAIPDNSTIGLTLPIAVPATGVLSDINVRLNITHPHTADLRVFLTSPSGTRRLLILNSGGANGANFSNTVLDDEGTNGFISSASAPFTGSFKPVTALAPLDGEPIHGVWKLNILDTISGASGSVTNWSLDLAANHTCQPTNQLTADAIAPDHAAARSPDITAVITGTHFAADSLVRWTQGVTVTLLTPTQITDTRLLFPIPARLLTITGTAQVQVVVPAPDGRVSSPLPFVIGKQAQTITLGPLPNRTLNPPSFPITVSASSGLKVTLSGSGVCTVTDTIITLNGVGTCTIVASQPGNEIYEAAPSVTRSFVVSTTGVQSSLRVLIPFVRK